MSPLSHLFILFLLCYTCGPAILSRPQKILIPCIIFLYLIDFCHTTQPQIIMQRRYWFGGSFWQISCFCLVSKWHTLDIYIYMMCTIYSQVFCMMIHSLATSLLAFLNLPMPKLHSTVSFLIISKAHLNMWKKDPSSCSVLQLLNVNEWVMVVNGTSDLYGSIISRKHPTKTCSLLPYWVHDLFCSSYEFLVSLHQFTVSLETATLNQKSSLLQLIMVCSAKGYLFTLKYAEIEIK